MTSRQCTLWIWGNSCPASDLAAALAAIVRHRLTACGLEARSQGLSGEPPGFGRQCRPGGPANPRPVRGWRSRSISFSRASARFRCCERWSSAVMTRMPSRLRRRPARAARRALISQQEPERPRRRTAVRPRSRSCSHAVRRALKRGRTFPRSRHGRCSDPAQTRSGLTRQRAIRRSGRSARPVRGGGRVQAGTPYASGPRNKGHLRSRSERHRSGTRHWLDRPSATGSSTPAGP